MNTALVKIVPTALVVGVGGFLAWPYVGPDAPRWDAATVAASAGMIRPAAAASAPAPAPGPAAGGAGAPAAAAKSAAKEIPLALLEPTLPLPLVRDPFCDPEAERARFRASIAAAITKVWAEKFRPPPKGRLASNRTIRTVGRPVDRAGPKGTVAEGAAKPAPVDPLAGLTLNATYIMGRKGAAVINNVTYTPGQPVAYEGGSAGVPLLLAEVRKYSVVLWYGGKPLELKYSDIKTEATAPGAKPASKGASGGTKAKGGGKKKGYDPFDV